MHTPVLATGLEPDCVHAATVRISEAADVTNRALSTAFYALNGLTHPPQMQEHSTMVNYPIN